MEPSSPSVTFFLQGGVLSQAFPGYQARPQQIEMARAVEDAVIRGTRLVVEAPTGVGKSLAYLVPSALHCGARGGGKKPALVVTDNIALQEQLITKDLPLLCDVLGDDPLLTFALAKGRTNYVCRESTISYAELNRTGLPPEELRQADTIYAWAQETATGDKNELPFVPSDSAWAHFTRDSDTCIGPFGFRCHECFISRARVLWASADVVVANYHLLLRDLQSGGAILPHRKALILDEGHRLVPLARECLGVDLSHAMIRRVVAPLDGEIPDKSWTVAPPALGLEENTGSTPDNPPTAYAHYHVRNQTIKAATVFFEALGEQFNRGNFRLGTARSPLPVAPLLGYLAWAIRVYGTFAGSEDQPQNRLELLCRRRSERCQELRAILHSCVSSEDGIEYFHVEKAKGTRDPYVRLKSIILDPSEWLRQLYRAQNTVVLTSATLRLSGSFTNIVRDTGLTDTKTLAVSSPFDYANNVLLVTPNLQVDVPNKAEDRPAYAAAVAATMGDIVRETQGRTLALFTANDIRDAVTRHLRSAQLPYTILCQGDAPKMMLIRRFREDTSSILIGVDSFWQGVDIPGVSLSCLVIDRLPIEPPNRPVHAAFLERFPDAYERYTLPTAATKFLQGFGRLIRSVEDRGVVIVLDRRVYLNTRFKRWFLDSLPPGIPHMTDLTRIRPFLDGEPALPPSPFR